MKNLKLKYSILIAAFAALTFSACTNLDETVYSDITAEKTHFTSEDVTNLIAPAFTALRNVYWGWDGLADLYEESSDCIVVPNRLGIGWGDYYVTMHQHTWSAANESHPYTLWQQAYNGITYVNRAIYQLDQISGIQNKDAYVYELRGLRAFYYYLLFDNFRNIPIVTKYDLPKGYLPKQCTPDSTYRFIVSELTTAMPYLSDANTKATYGRFTKWAAKMTLAKLYLNHEVYFGSPMWAEAQAQVEDVINSGKFKLADNYRDPFLFDNSNSVEQIFSIPFDPIYASGSYYPFKTLYAASQATYNLSGQPWGGSGAIPQFIDTYDPDDSRLKDSWLGGPQYTSSGTPLILDTDPDKGKQLNYINYMSDVNGCYYNEGYRLVKYEIKSGTNAATGNDVPLFRYTDALMIKAECLLRQGKADEAAAIVTQVRQRDFKSNPAKATVTGAKLAGGSSYKYGAYSNGKITSYEGGADIKYGGFLDELGWEFVGEHHRKQDLIRFNVYTTKSWFCKTKKDDNMKIFAIPQDFMNANSNLKQNPGY
ncbi:RagB/SusD family nutrient uptake outer membrane protein [Paludibacter sp.]|uniref:RagB/SusD family nutrient uptake outer membrane protein n=1 Tax=Paludibacter sp. TaxID=1898105 RepID=UPI0025E68610|nr:RagB/SusD family nutrient uptake outer membrane protein [Paludibacter sp.]